jgi:hypothetical protein
MPGLNGRTRTFRLSVNKRIAKYACLILDPTNSTQTSWFCKLPTSASPGTPWTQAPLAGVAIYNFFEPNFFAAQDTDPTTITGTTPTSPYVLGGTGVQDNGPGITLQYDGEARVQLSADGAVSDGDVLLIADVYGRVNNPANLSVSTGTYCYQVGIAIGKGTNENDVLWARILPIQAAVA